MAPILRSRLALAALLGVLLIPIGTSSLRGLTHVLTCQERTNVPFTVSVPNVTSSSRITRNEPLELCGGLTLNLQVKVLSPTRAQVALPITNHTKYTWEGSVSLNAAGTSVPVSIGRIRPGHTRTSTLTVHIPHGSHQIEGSLLIGP